MKQDRDISGAICIDKPGGVTSHDVVNRMRRLYGTRKVGHTGTLDPMATGALVILVGRAAKAAEYITAQEKEYAAEFRLGIRTDSGDITGIILETDDGLLPSPVTVARAAEGFAGEILQTPPMYSALKVDGRKLVDLARRGIEVERAARPITVHSLTVEAIDAAHGNYRLHTVCSKGTYIRTLCEDIARAAGTVGTMTALRRLRTGGFCAAGAPSPDDLDGMTQAERDALLLPIPSLFSDLPAVTLPPFFAKLAHSGCEIYQRKIGASFPIGQKVTLWDADGFFALAQSEAFPDGDALRCVKQFRI